MRCTQSVSPWLSRAKHQLDLLRKNHTISVLLNDHTVQYGDSRAIHNLQHSILEKGEINPQKDALKGRCRLIK